MLGTTYPSHARALSASAGMKEGGEWGGGGGGGARGEGDLGGR